MPYISQIRRSQLDTGAIVAETAGELNYVLTQIALKYLEGTEVVCYRTLNDVMGALESAKQEFYRRVVAPYEEKKRAENGDVYFYD